MTDIILLIADILIIVGGLIILLCAISFCRNKNILHILHYVILANIYGVSTILIGIAIRKYEMQSAIKIIVIIILNLIISVILNRILNQNICGDKKELEGIKICKISF